MKELILQLFDRFTLISGQGKLAVIFLAALIVLSLIWKSGRSRIHPLLFVLSAWTGIAHALSSLVIHAFSCGNHDEGETPKKKKGYALLACIFLVVALTLSGGLIWSSTYLASAAECRDRERDYAALFDAILADDEHPGILASNEMMPFAAAYSTRLTPLYDPSRQSELADTFASERPDFSLALRTCGKYARTKGNLYFVLDNEKMWPLREPAEDSVMLFYENGHYLIYKYSGGARE